MKPLFLHIWLVAAVACLGPFGCGGEDSGKSVGKVVLNVYSVKFDTPDMNPFVEVAYMRIRANGQGVEQVVKTKYVPGSSVNLDWIPFGKNIQITVEGLTADPVTGQSKNVVSRGRSNLIDIGQGTGVQTINVMFSRLNTFAKTTAEGPNGSFATSMVQGRVGHTATLLKDGRVFIAGGARLSSASGGLYKSPNDLEEIFNTAEIYDPQTGLYIQLSGPNSTMANGRAFHTATLLPDGRVLIAGGITDISGSFQTLPLMQSFEPVSGVFEEVLATSLMKSRAGHTATLIDDVGRVLFSGGFELNQQGTQTVTESIEVYDRNDGVIYSTQFEQARFFHTANRVPLGAGEQDGIIFIGGQSGSQVLDTAEIFYLYPPGMNAELISIPSGARTRHTATYVENQRFIHVVGGFTDLNHTETEQKIDSFQTASVTFADSDVYLLESRGGHAATNLPGNAVVLFGGFSNGQLLETVEVIFEYAENGQMHIERGSAGKLSSPRGVAQGILLENKTVLAIGGVGVGGELNALGEFFNPL